MSTIYTALLAAQKSINAAKKDANNPFFKSKYADLEAIIKAVKVPLNEAGIVILQTQETIYFEGGSKDVIRTTLVDTESGESIKSDCPIICKEVNNPQALGSAITYARRYGLQTITCLPTEDDDGNAATSTPLKTADMPDGVYEITVTSEKHGEKAGKPWQRVFSEQGGAWVKDMNDTTLEVGRTYQVVIKSNIILQATSK